MKHALALVLLAPLLVLDTAAAEAHPAPYAHHHGHRGRAVKVVRHRHPVHRHPVWRPAPPPVVVYSSPAPVVVSRPVVVSEPTVVREAAPEPAPYDPDPLALGVRVSGVSLSGEKVGLSHAENPTMGGLGAHLRTRFDDHLGLEIAVDLLGGSGSGFEQTTVPVMGSLTYHLFPGARIQPYALAGAGVHFTTLEYLDGKFDYHLTEFAGQAGGGLEVFLTKDLSIQGDLRAQTVFRNVDTHAEVRQDCLEAVGSMSGFCDGIHQADPGDKLELGMMFQAGLNFYF